MDSSSSADIWEMLNWVDVCLLIALIGFLFVGLGLGFYRQLAIAVALLLGLVAASQLSAPLAATDLFSPLRDKLGEAGASVLAYGAILATSLLLGLGVLLIFRSFFGTSMKVVDALLGSLLGVLLGCLVFGLFTLGVFHFEETDLHQPIQASLVGSRIAEAARVASRMFPEELRDRVEAGFEKRVTGFRTDEVEIQPASHRDEDDPHR